MTNHTTKFSKNVRFLSPHIPLTRFATPSSKRQNYWNRAHLFRNWNCYFRVEIVLLSSGVANFERADRMDVDVKITVTDESKSKSKKSQLESSSDSDDSDVPLSKRSRASSVSDALSSLVSDAQSDSGSDDESSEASSSEREPKKRAVRHAISDFASANQAKSVKPARKVSDSESSNAPLVKRVKTPVERSKSVKVKEESDSEDVPLSQKATPRKRKRDDDKPKTKVKVKKEEPEEDDTHKWWMNVDDLDKAEKWQTLEHAGPLFPPEYVPHGVMMKYDGKPVHLDPPQEEVASFYAALIGTDWVANPVFRKNFFDDWMELLKKQSPRPPIKKLDLCDFTPIQTYLETQKEERLAMTKPQKEAIKKEKAELDEKYGIALVDGRKEKVGNFRIEPPGLFRGRGAHPKAGKLKARVRPEDVSINIGQKATVPKPPPGHNWREVVHDNTVGWLATWNENINNNTKYIQLSAQSSFKGQSDYKKFEKARDLKKSVKHIRADYTRDMKDPLMAKRQLATAVYFIDRLALRAGNEKGEDVADTVGCCSLRYEHVTLEKPDKVVFDFLGKDSIRYYNVVQVDPQVFKNIKIFKKDPKKEGDDLFDRVDTTILNRHLQSYQKSLSAKVFRTYNASYTFQEELKKTPTNGSVADKVLAYNRANRQVAILCNHQRAVSKGHNDQLEKLKDKLRAIKYDRRQVKRDILDIDPKLKKKHPEYAESESDLDDDWIKGHKKALVEKEKEALQKKLEKENDKLKEEGKPLLIKIDPPPKRSPGLEALEKSYQRLTERIAAAKTSIVDKDENKSTALSTSKINYSTFAFCIL